MQWFVVGTGVGARAPTYFHGSFESADREARRLCQSTGKEFYVVAIVSIVRPVIVPETEMLVGFGQAINEIQQINASVTESMDLLSSHTVVEQEVEPVRKRIADL